MVWRYSLLWPIRERVGAAVRHAAKTRNPESAVFLPKVIIAKDSTHFSRIDNREALRPEIASFQYPPESSRANEPAELLIFKACLKSEFFNRIDPMQTAANGCYREGR
jgi:hypothetical protein